MKFEKYFISDKLGKSNCIIRTFCKLFNKEYEDVAEELNSLALDLGYKSYAEISVFETYLNNNNYYICEDYSSLQVKDLNLTHGKYAIFCYDKKDFYHMNCIIDGVVYDKDEKNLVLYVINVYKEKL